jgi:lipopolysaccharide/colanic/teichoic acid biosynthesis glycosyltransferase
MIEVADVSPTQSVPFLVPPDGRPQTATAQAVGTVRERLNTKRAQDALDKIHGAMSWHKRLVDILGASAAMVLFSPVFVIVAALIKLTDWGPVLFWQRRAGLHGREFWFPKFRSMTLNANRLIGMLTNRNDHATQVEPSVNGKQKDVTFKMKEDPRVTWIGRVIRRLSMDEMPQFWCVLKGDMSLVGPRPPLPTEVVRYSPHDRRRLEVKPGLTCIWQVSGRGDLPFPQQVAMDIEYIEKRGFWVDLKLMLLTIPAVLSGKGAY